MLTVTIVFETRSLFFIILIISILTPKTLTMMHTRNVIIDTIIKRLVGQVFPKVYRQFS